MNCRYIISMFVIASCTNILLAAEGALNGKFTINDAGDQIVFSKGNLQFNVMKGMHSTKTSEEETGIWRFAENQYDKIGQDNRDASSSFDGWIDLFGWGTSGYNNTINDPFAINYQPYSTSNSEINKTCTIRGDEIDSINCEAQAITGKCDTIWKDERTYSSAINNSYGYGPSYFIGEKNLVGNSANYDWGVYNAISNGGNEPESWRTLTFSEWEYLFGSRHLAKYLYSKATVCYVHGYILLPDDFTLPEGLTWIHNAENWDANNYDSEAWSIMEAKGAVFLPAAGIRVSTSVYNNGSFGSYWSSTCNQSEIRGVYAMRISFGDGGDFAKYNQRSFGMSVRLVKAVNKETPSLIKSGNTELQAIKQLRHNQLIIIRGEKTYNIQGQEVK